MGLHRIAPGARRVGALAGATLIASAGLYYALRGLNWPAFRQQVSALDWRWLVLAVIFDIASYCAQGLRWHLLLPRASVWRTTRAIYAGLFLNELVPLRPGEAFRAWLAARDLGVSTGSIVPSMVTERLMDGFCLAIPLLIAARLAPMPSYLGRIIWLTTLTAATVALAAWSLRKSRLAPLARMVTAVFRNPRALTASGCFVVFQGLAFWAVIRASHLPLAVAAAFVVMLIVRVGTLLPGAPANLGSHQLATVLGLSLYGVPHVQAAGVSLVLFAVLTIPLCVIGCGALLSAMVRRQPAEENAPTPAARAARSWARAKESASIASSRPLRAEPCPLTWRALRAGTPPREDPATAPAR